MLPLQKLAFVLLFACAAGCAQTGSAAPPQSDSNPQAGQSSPGQSPSQSSPSTPEPDKKAPAEQAPSSPPPDSTKLEAIKTEKAGYSWEAREKQLQGQVWVKILVSETGDVESAEVISGDPILADSAVRAVKKWKFKPFIKNGKPVKVSTKLPFDFAYSDKVSDEKAPPDASAPNPNSSSGTTAPQRVRVSAGVSQGLLLHKVAPVYPPEARQARIQGLVVLQAKISKEGRIEDLKVISGHPELVPAAIGAVQQWRYRPYLLMGNPVEVDTQIQVNFQLR
jgi:TonB family protein